MCRCSTCSIVDRIPAGFRYVQGSARIDRVPVEPAVAGRELIWSDLAVDRQESHEMLVLLAVGAGVSEGEFVNRVQAVHMLTGTALSNEASATVRVVPDPTFDCTDVTGKVFDDVNRNGYQDQGETGLPGVRVVSARGLTATTDALRALPHHLRGRAARGTRQQLRPEAGRPHAAERLSLVDGPGAHRARHSR